MNYDDDTNIVEMLREKTEEADLKQYLKRRLGGYTKKSVQEYFNILRKQQQTSNETFSRNLQVLFEEKESIRKNNESLLASYNKLSGEYDSLSESFKGIKLDDSEFSAQDIISLKNNEVILEEQVKITNREKITLEKKINHLNRDKDDLILRLEQSTNETQAQKQMLRAERLESKKQRDKVADLSLLLEEEKAEIKYLNGVMSDGKISELAFKVNELTEQLTTQTNVMEKLNSEIVLKSETIEKLENEIDVLKLRISNLTKTVKSINIQNDKLMLSNETLTNNLEKEYKNSIAIIKDKSNITIDKLVIQRKLSDSESENSLLIYEIEKVKNSKDTESINSNLAELIE